MSCYELLNPGSKAITHQNKPVITLCLVKLTHTIFLDDGIKFAEW